MVIVPSPSVYAMRDAGHVSSMSAMTTMDDARGYAPLSNSENASLNSAECHKPRSAPRTTAHTLCTHQRFALFAAGDGRVSDQNIVSRAVTRQTFRLGRRGACQALVGHRQSTRLTSWSAIIWWACWVLEKGTGCGQTWCVGYKLDGRGRCVLCSHLRRSTSAHFHRSAISISSRLSLPLHPHRNRSQRCASHKQCIAEHRSASQSTGQRVKGPQTRTALQTGTSPAPFSGKTNRLFNPRNSNALTDTEVIPAT